MNVKLIYENLGSGNCLMVYYEDNSKKTIELSPFEMVCSEDDNEMICSETENVIELGDSILQISIVYRKYSLRCFGIVGKELNVEGDDSNMDLKKIKTKTLKSFDRRVYYLKPENIKGAEEYKAKINTYITN